MTRIGAASRSRVGILCQSEPDADGGSGSSHIERLRQVFEALNRRHVLAEPVVYTESHIEEVRQQLLQLDGVLVWVNPIEDGHDRTSLDALLREVACAGVFVSAHPDVILKMGTKQVLFRTRDVGWGTDVELYRSLDELHKQLPQCLAMGQPWVLKQHRGHGGNGVWKVALPETPARNSCESTGLAPQTLISAGHAKRGCVEQEMTFGEFIESCAGYFAGQGCMIGQAYQKRLTDGMVRCYFVHDKVAGFGHQAVNALFPAPPGKPASDAPQPGPRLYYPPTKPEFQALKHKLEKEWVAAMQRVLEIGTNSLPIIWDADFLYGPRTASQEDTYVLCEINVSSVYPFPESALEPLAQAATRIRRHSSCHF